MIRRLLPALLLIAAAPALADGDRVKTVVVPFDAVQADPNVVEALTQVVQGAFARDAFRDVLGPDDIRRVLDFEADRQKIGCTDGGCLEEIAAALDAQRLVLGRVILVDDELLVVVSEVDSTSLSVLARGEQVVPTEADAMVQGVRQLALKVAERSKAAATDRPTGSLSVTTDPPGAQIRVSGQSIGFAPVTVDGINEGLHEVTVAPRDAAPFVVNVTVERDATSAVRVDVARTNLIDPQGAEALISDELWGHGFTLAKLSAASLLYLVGSMGVFAAGLTATLLVFAPDNAWVTTTVLVGVPTAGLLLGGLALSGWALFDIATLADELPVKPAAHQIVLEQQGREVGRLSVPVGGAAADGNDDAQGDDR